ncbi:hypothetical protein [Pseudoteredinibacter isoporae]|uniref:hypothetical protein n=1 Tax=Pseudoteredinibacter isoporae TaxID=570281 RepID=UPI0033418B34
MRDAIQDLPCALFGLCLLVVLAYLHLQEFEFGTMGMFSLAELLETVYWIDIFKLIVG